jgi:exodeoxyribonuclease-3
LAICGDFNIAPEDIDVFDPEQLAGQILVSAEERGALEAIKSWGLTDTFRLHNQEPGHYSWWDYRMNAFRRKMGLRIDHIWVTKALADRCKRSWIDMEPRKLERPSDHAPVAAEFSD